MIDSVSLTGLPEIQPQIQKDSPERVRNAATQFEGLLIGEMLKTARESSDGGWMGSGDDAGSDSAMGLMLSALMSRCMIPFSCAAARPSAT